MQESGGYISSGLLFPIDIKMGGERDENTVL